MQDKPTYDEVIKAASIVRIYLANKVAQYIKEGKSKTAQDLQYMPLFQGLEDLIKSSDIDVSTKPDIMDASINSEELFENN